MADTAYDADHLREAIAAKGAGAVIPNNPSRALKHRLDKHLYAQRHLVESCFSKRSVEARPCGKLLRFAKIAVWLRKRAVQVQVDGLLMGRVRLFGSWKILSVMGGTPTEYAGLVCKPRRSAIKLRCF
jgi:hypothetical protein